jgi:hypothetical protein
MERIDIASITTVAKPNYEGLFILPLLLLYLYRTMRSIDFTSIEAKSILPHIPV